MCEGRDDLTNEPIRVFYFDELPTLADKEPDALRRIYLVKDAFHGARVVEQIDQGDADVVDQQEQIGGRNKKEDFMTPGNLRRTIRP